MPAPASVPATAPADPGLFAALWQWCEQHPAVLAWAFAGSLLSLVLVAALLPVIVARLAPDHFLHPRREMAVRGGIYHWPLRIVKNVLGVVFLLAGFLMLFLPGQGLLTMLIGLLLVEFPGKRALERRLIRRPRLRAFLDGIRARRGRPPFQIDEPAPP